MLEQIALGQEFEIWPPHITIVPWFPCDDAARLDATLSKVATRHLHFAVKAGKVEQWGKKEKFDVQKIEDEGPLHKLHWDVFHSLEKSGFSIHQKNFMGEKYRPHIALRNRLQQGSEFPRGQEVQITEFTLIKQLRLKKSGRMIKTPVKEYKLA